MACTNSSGALSLVMKPSAHAFRTRTPNWSSCGLQFLEEIHAAFPGKVMPSSAASHPFFPSGSRASSPALFATHLIFSLTFFNDHEGDVVSLRHALSEFFNGLQELLLERVTSRRGLLPNDS